MKRRSVSNARLGGWAGVALVLITTPITGRAEDPPPIGTQVGQMYPDFLLPKLDGGFGRLSDYRGKKVLLIHFASW